MSYIARNLVVLGLGMGLAVSPTQAQKKQPKAVRVDVAVEREALTGSDHDRAVAAAGALGAATAGDAYEALADGLSMGLAPVVATAALDALAARADARAFDVIAHYLHYRNPRVRAAAVRAMGALDDARARPQVLAALSDSDAGVRGAAARIVASRKIREGIDPLLELIKKGDEPAASALAELADPALAAAVGELIGTAPDRLLAQCLGAILMRADFKPESARLEVVRTLGKVPGNDALEQLTTYVASTPENPPRQSRREAEAIVEARLGGD